MDFKKFYLSPEGRVNRKQFWLWLVVPLTVIGVLLAFLDVATGNYNPEMGFGLFSGISSASQTPGPVAYGELVKQIQTLVGR